MRRFRLPALLSFVLTLTLLLSSSASVSAAEDWVVDSFDSQIAVRTDGTIEVTEDIRVDFQSMPDRHGIIRDIPVLYRYDEGHNRRITLEMLGVDDGQNPVRYSRSNNGALVSLRIGDPDRTVSGKQRYRIRYRMTGALNPQPGQDELFFNATGNSWTVPIMEATATVTAPAIGDLRCLQGPTGSTQPCNATRRDTTASFAATRALPSQSGMTIVVGLPEGSVNVPPLDLVEVKSPEEQIRDFLGLKPLVLAGTLLFGIGALGMVGRYWWLNGRDRWYGDVHYLTESEREGTRPLFARDTIVTEYTPPELAKERRELRPAEIGTLIDEGADTRDVSATIVDLAVRGYLRIVELPKEGLFGKVDYRLEKLKAPDDALLAYERVLHDALFDGDNEVTMSELRNKFYTDLAKVKKELYVQVTERDQFFSESPESARTTNVLIAMVAIAVGVAAIVGLGIALGAALLGVPIVLAGLALLAFSHNMPRRTGTGREMYRRALGFREYMVIAETDRQKFAEEANIFQKYLPYAIVYDCVDKWARAFEGLAATAAAGAAGWYVGHGVFSPIAFSHNLEGFSSSMSTAIASTPGGSGSSGFSSGGGFSGGGVGGGGGSSW